MVAVLDTALARTAWLSFVSRSLFGIVETARIGTCPRAPFHAWIAARLYALLPSPPSRLTCDQAVACKPFFRHRVGQSLQHHGVLPKKILTDVYNFLVDCHDNGLGTGCGQRFWGITIWVQSCSWWWIQRTHSWPPADHEVCKGPASRARPLRPLRCRSRLQPHPTLCPRCLPEWMAGWMTETGVAGRSRGCSGVNAPRLPGRRPVVAGVGTARAHRIALLRPLSCLPYACRVPPPQATAIAGWRTGCAGCCCCCGCVSCSSTQSLYSAEACKGCATSCGSV